MNLHLINFFLFCFLCIVISAGSFSVACPSQSVLAKSLASWLAGAGFQRTLDTSAPDRQVHHLNNVDMTVLVFPPASLSSPCPPLLAQALLSRDYPLGRALQHDAAALEPLGVDWRWWDPDRWDSYDPAAWTAPPQGDWFGQVLPPAEAAPQSPPFMMAHPASSFKLMVATGVLVALQEGLLSTSSPAAVNITEFADVSSPRFAFNGTVDSAMRAMLTYSDNSATTALLALLHAAGMLEADWQSPTNRLASLFGALGLPLLRLEGTQPGGYWGYPTAEQRNRSAFYDTTGFFHMGSLDAAKLVWLLNPKPNAAPAWLVDGAPVNASFLLPQWKGYVYGILQDQAFHDVLSSTATCGQPGRRQGLPSAEPALWVQQGDEVVVEGKVMSHDVTPCQQQATVTFYHKTGSTHTVGSDVGFVESIAAPQELQYIVAIVGNLGTRFIDRDLASYGDPCDAVSICYTQNIPHIGLQLHEFISNISWV